MGTLDKDAASYDKLYPYVRDDMEHGRPLRAIDYIVDLWPEAVTTPGIKKQALEWLRDAITQAGGDADLFSRSYTRDKDVEKAVRTGCGHLFWMEAQALYRDMVAGKQSPENVYLLIEEDLRHAGKTARDAKQHRFSHYTIAPVRAQADTIRTALWAREQGAPLAAGLSETLRTIITTVMEKHLKNAHIASPGTQLGI